MVSLLARIVELERSDIFATDRFGEDKFSADVAKAEIVKQEVEAGLVRYIETVIIFIFIRYSDLSL